MSKKLLLCLLSLACVLTACTTSGAPDATTAPADVRFYFVQVTDTHFGEADAEARAIKTVEAVNALPMKIECVVHTGDITKDRIDDEKVVAGALEVMGKLKAPVHYVAGNHDIRRSGDHEALMGTYRKSFGPPATKAEYNGVVFLMLYTELVGEAFSIEGYDPLKWLEQALIEAKGKPVIVFHHGPSVGNFSENKMHEGWTKEPLEKWQKLLNTYNVKAVIAGHFHRDEHHWIGNVPLYVAPAVSGAFDRNTAYRVYEYANGKVGYRTQYPGTSR